MNSASRLPTTKSQLREQSNSKSRLRKQSSAEIAFTNPKSRHSGCSETRLLAQSSLGSQSGLCRTSLAVCTIAILAISIVTLAGCKTPLFGGKTATSDPVVAEKIDSPFRPTPEPADPTTVDEPTDDAEPNVPPNDDRPVRRVSVKLNVVRITAPKGGLSRNRDIWRLVTGALADASVSASLRDNGILAAIGRESDREALTAALEKIPDHRSALDSLEPNEARLVELVLGPCAKNQKVFHYDRAGKLSGNEFSDGQAKLRMAYEVRSARMDDVMLQLMPEIEEPPGPPKWVVSASGATEVREDRRHSFRELVMGGTIPPGGFIMIGPTADVYAHPLLGRAFFVETNRTDPETDDWPRESLVIISPIVTTVGRPTPEQGQSPAESTAAETARDP